ARMTPLRFLVGGPLCHRTQGTNCASVGTDRRTRNPGARGLVHERHELVRESRHGAADADAAHVGGAADTSHPSAFRYVAVHYWSPATQFHDAFRRAIHFREVTLLVVSGPIA